MDLPVPLRITLVIAVSLSIVWAAHIEKGCNAGSHCPKWHFCESSNSICMPCMECGEGDSIHESGNCDSPTMCSSGQHYITCPKLQGNYPGAVLHNGNQITYLGESIHTECNITGENGEIYHVSSVLDCLAEFDNTTNMFSYSWHGNNVCVTQVPKEESQVEEPTVGKDIFVLAIIIPLGAMALIAMLLGIRKKQIKSWLKKCGNSDYQISASSPLGNALVNNPTGTDELSPQCKPDEVIDNNSPQEVSSVQSFDNSTNRLGELNTERIKSKGPDENSCNSIAQLPYTVEGNNIVIPLSELKRLQQLPDVTTILETTLNHNNELVHYTQPIQETNEPGEQSFINICSDVIQVQIPLLQRQPEEAPSISCINEEQSKTIVKVVASTNTLDEQEDESCRIKLLSRSHFHSTDDQPKQHKLDDGETKAKELLGNEDDSISDSSEIQSWTSETEVKNIVGRTPESSLVSNSGTSLFDEHSDYHSSVDNVWNKGDALSSDTGIKAVIVQNQPQEHECGPSLYEPDELDSELHSYEQNQCIHHHGEMLPQEARNDIEVLSTDSSIQPQGFIISSYGNRWCGCQMISSYTSDSGDTQRTTSSWNRLTINIHPNDHALSIPRGPSSISHLENRNENCNLDNARREPVENSWNSSETSSVENPPSETHHPV